MIKKIGKTMTFLAVGTIFIANLVACHICDASKFAINNRAQQNAKIDTIKLATPQGNSKSSKAAEIVNHQKLFGSKSRVDTAKTPHVKHKLKHYQNGIASWYGHGTKTASGIKFDPKKLTAAHRKLPFGSLVKVTNLDNGLSINVTITDRGPYIKGRVIDLSRQAAKELDMLDGLAHVTLELVSNE